MGLILSSLVLCLCNLLSATILWGCSGLVGPDVRIGMVMAK